MHSFFYIELDEEIDTSLMSFQLYVKPKPGDG